MKTLVIANITHKKSEKLEKILRNKYPNIEIITNSKEEIPNTIDYAIKNKIELIISAGGDGSINLLINEVMKRNKKVQKQFTFAVIPLGKANDLARKLNIPLNFKKAIAKILSGKKDNLDLIKVNKKYFITGGGFGLPKEVVIEKERYPQLSFLKDKIYLFNVIKIIFKGYKGTKKIYFNYKNYDNLMLFSVMNQNFIGKRFFLSPNAKNNDGLLDVCIIDRPNNLLKQIYMLIKVINKKHVNLNWAKHLKLKKLSVLFEKKEHFMADGELLDSSDKFDFSVMPKAITFLH